MAKSAKTPIVCSAGNSSWRPIINLGLPRTGTSSYSAVTLSLGMTTTHGCSKSHPLKELGPCFYEGMVEGHCFLEGGGAASRPMHHPVARATIDSHSDTPWFMVDAKRLRAAYPQAGLVCTTRSAKSWVRSMLDFFNRSQSHGAVEVPGGMSFMWHMQKVLLRHWPPIHPTAVKLRRSPFILYEDALHTFHELHHAGVCANVPLIQLDADDARGKWGALCSAVPHGTSFQRRCLSAIAAARPWPSVNAAIGAEMTRQAAYHREVWAAAQALGATN